MVPCGSSPAARLYLAKNEAPEEEADLGLCCNQMWDAFWQRFEPRTQNTVMYVTFGLLKPPSTLCLKEA